MNSDLPIYDKNNVHSYLKIAILELGKKDLFCKRFVDQLFTILSVNSYLWIPWGPMYSGQVNITDIIIY